VGGGAVLRWAPYHVVANLLGFAATSWDELDGVLLLRGVDIWQLPFDRALNVLYALLMEHRDEKDRMRLQAALDMPLPHQIARARDDLWWNHEADAAAWTSAAGQLGGLMG
jgi:hypothetical protein